MNPPRRIRATTRRLLIAGVAALAIIGIVGPVPSANAVGGPTGLNGIGPGTPLLIERPDGDFGCTANFVFDVDGARYLGTAGHCLQPPGGSPATAVYACETNCVFGAATNPFNSVLGDLTELCDPCTASTHFPVLHNGMSGNDFAVIKLPSSVTERTTVPIWDGPTGTTTASPGDAVCYYGNGVVVGETTPTKARAAAVVTPSNSTRWFAEGAATTGDSGAPVVDCVSEAAVGIQNAIACTTGTLVAPATAMCGTTIDRAISLGKSSLGSSFSLVDG